jgi:hypothetical protein
MENWVEIDDGDRLGSDKRKDLLLEMAEPRVGFLSLVLSHMEPRLLLRRVALFDLLQVYENIL